MSNRVYPQQQQQPPQQDQQPKQYKIKTVEESLHWINNEIRKIREIMERTFANGNDSDKIDF